MSLTTDFQAASFRGVSFLVAAESTARGKKVAIHEYPNSDRRFVEELGKLPPIFTIEAIVHGDDLINKRLRLEKALERPGQGLLVHPVYGTLTVSALTFTTSSRQAESGQFIFNIRFASSEENITPTPLPPQRSTVSQKAKAARDAIGTVLQDRYQPPSTAFNTDFQVEETLSTWENLEATTDVVIDQISTQAAKFKRTLRTARATVYQAVQTGQKIKTSIETVVDAALNIVSNPSDLDGVWNALITLTSFPNVVRKTAQQIQRSASGVLTNEHFQLISLANSFESKAFTDYLTDIDVDAARSFLGEKYTVLLLNAPATIAEDGLESITTDPDARAAFADLRETADGVFAELESAAFRVVDIVPGKSSLALTTFRFTGSIEQVRNFAGLNDINPANFNLQAMRALSR